MQEGQPEEERNPPGQVGGGALSKRRHRGTVCFLSQRGTNAARAGQKVFKKLGAASRRGSRGAFGGATSQMHPTAGEGQGPATKLVGTNLLGRDSAHTLGLPESDLV